MGDCVLDEQDYDHYISDIASRAIDYLKSHLEGYKIIGKKRDCFLYYLANCELFEKSKVILYSKAVTLWDCQQDGLFLSFLLFIGELIVLYENEYFHVILTIFVIRCS